MNQMKKMNKLAISDSENKCDKMTNLIGENAELKQLYQEASSYKTKFLKKNKDQTKQLR